MPTFRKHLLLCAASLALCSHTHASTISGPWTLIQDSNSTGLTAVGGTLASPSIGDGVTTANIANSGIAGAFNNINLANPGDVVCLTGSFSFVGGGATSGDVMRFGLFNDPADTAVGAVTTDGGASPANNTGWFGYWFSNSHNTTTGRLVERSNPNANLAISSFGTTNLQTHLATGSAPFDVAPSNVYNFNLTVTRQANGSLNIDYLLTNGAGYVLSGATVNDPTPNTYDFDRVGFLVAGGQSAARVVFSNVDVGTTAAPPQVPVVTRGPYLQNGSTTATTVRWRTNASTDSVVRYGLTPGNLNQTASNATSTTEHEIRITGLTPDTTYYYSVGNAANTLAGGNDYFVVTAPTGAKPTRIWVLGDAGWNSSTQANVRNAYYNFTGTRHTDLWMMLGDNAYNNGTDAEYTTNMFAYYPAMMRKSVLWSTYGNHDSYSADSATQTGPYYNQHTFPKNGEAGGVASGTEAYYSYDYGNIHFISLDSMESSRSATGTMANWLRSDLANTTKDWVIVFFHHPPYSKGSHNSDTETTMVEMRTNIAPILEEYGVDLVLNGHSHSYERSFFIDGHYGISTTFNESMKVQPGNGQGAGAYTKAGMGPIPHSGAVYTVAGASGITSGGTLNHPAMCVSLNVAGSLVLDVDGGTLNATYIDSTGATRDAFSMVKSSGNQAPTVSITGPANGASFTQPAAVVIDATAADSDGSVTKVDFYEDGNLIGTDTSSPYSLTWSNAPIGVHSLTAVATDNAGATRTSAAVSVTVNSESNVIASFQDGVNGYAGTRDTTIKSDAATANFGTSTTLLFDGSPDYATLISWDLTSIPANKTVTAASITFNVVDWTAQSYGLYAVNKTWVETEATWRNARAGNSNKWQTAGALGSADFETPLLGTVAPTAFGSYTVNLNAAGIAKVQQWISTPATNMGLLLRDYNTSDGGDLSSSEDATISNRPKITVTYH